LSIHGPAPLKLPARIHQYRLLRQLGWGGTSIVCEAEDTALDRRVAIKLICRECASWTAAPRLLCELAAQVRHPHVVSLYAAGTYAGGTYVVMELLEGGSVQARLDGGPLPWRQATAILISACAGVTAVHARGIIHHDIKPANLLCTADGIVKLADFDLACRRGSVKRMAGTPHYMSPEQCREEGCDERTDVYSLGATYYTLLTGCTPYADASPVQVMFAHCSVPVPDPLKVRRGIPSACAAIIRQALAKKRVDRYSSARELQEALRAALLGRSNP
jgi:urea transport system substrate-binding protein